MSSMAVEPTHLMKEEHNGGRAMLTASPSEPLEFALEKPTEQVNGFLQLSLTLSSSHFSLPLQTPPSIHWCLRVFLLLVPCLVHSHVLSCLPPH